METTNSLLQPCQDSTFDHHHVSHFQHNISSYSRSRKEDCNWWRMFLNPQITNSYTEEPNGRDSLKFRRMFRVTSRYSRHVCWTLPLNCGGQPGMSMRLIVSTSQWLICNWSYWELCSHLLPGQHILLWAQIQTSAKKPIASFLMIGLKRWHQSSIFSSSFLLTTKCWRTYATNMLD